MNDMSPVIVPKSDQINADDLIAGPRTVKIREVRISGGKDQPVGIYVEGTDKAYRPCKSMCRCLVFAWGSDANAYVGRSLTLYRDPTVKWAGMEVGGIRISHMSDIANEITIALTASKTSRKPFTVKPLRTEPNTPVDPDVKAAGDEAAKGGVESYKTWLATLTPEVKATVAWFHKEWSRVAKAVVLPDNEIAFDAETVAEPADHVDPTIFERPADAEIDETDDSEPEQADDEKPLSKTESQRLDQIAAIREVEKDDPERVALVLDGRILATLTAGQVKDVFLAVTKA